MDNVPERPHQWFEVQRHLGQVHVARQSGDLPRPQPGQALLQMVACGICGADIRVVSGDKASSGESDRFTVLGHEGVGRIVAINDDAAKFQPGDYVVILSILSVLGAVIHCTWAGISMGVSLTSCLYQRQIWCVSPGSIFTGHRSKLLGFAKQFLP